VEEAYKLIDNLKDPDININLDEVMNELSSKELTSSFSPADELLRREDKPVVAGLIG